MLAHIKKVAGTFVAIATERFLHYIFLGSLRDPMIIESPPDFQLSVENVRVVVAVLCQSVMNDDRMQVVWPLLFLYIRLFQYLFNVLYFILQYINLVLRSVLESFQNMLSYFNLLGGHTKLTL